jgi:hypothetical protein
MQLSQMLQVVSLPPTPEEVLEGSVESGSMAALSQALAERLADVEKYFANAIWDVSLVALEDQRAHLATRLQVVCEAHHFPDCISDIEWRDSRLLMPSTSLKSNVVIRVASCAR